MLNEFYKYIANNTVSFFQSRADTIRPGERYCLKLDTEEMVQGVDQALREKTLADHIQGNYHYGNVYDTFTIIISANVEVVVASKINGMTDDFLATLRNAELTDKHFPILMVTHSPIDTITSGTGDLAANGMPFHATSIIAKIQQDIKTAQLSPADQKFLELELERKQEDRFSDKSSLFEYSNLLTVLGRGYIKPEDFAAFSLLYDDGLASIPVDRVKSRLQENHEIFDSIDRVVKHGNIADALDKEYDKKFIEHLQEAKKKGEPWYEDYTFTMVKASHDRVKVGNGKPLQIEDTDIEAFSGSPIEYCFLADEKMLIRSDGVTRQKQRRKNILIYNPDHKASVTVQVHTNIGIRPSWVECLGANASVETKKVSFTINASGCAFARASISDLNKNVYLFKICVLNLAPRYLEDIQTKYLLDVPNVYPDVRWEKVLEDFREALLNEQYTFSKQIDSVLGKGTIISFKTDVLNKSGSMQDDICILELPEKMGSEYMIKSAAEIEKELDSSTKEFPDRLRYLHHRNTIQSDATLTTATTVENDIVPETSMGQQTNLQPFISPLERTQPVIVSSSTSESDPDVEESSTEEPSEETENTLAAPEERKSMEIVFGKDMSTGAPLIWKPNDTNQVFHTNMGIIGTMGTGKTQFTKSLIAQLYRDQEHNFDGSPLGILIFDYKGDYNESKEDFIEATKAKVFKPYHLPFNPLALTESKVFKPLLPIHTANAFKDTLSKVYNLGAKQQNALFSCITRAYNATGIKPNDPSTWKNTPPTFDMVYGIYMDDEDIKKTDSLAAAMDKLYQFQVFEGDSTKTQSLFDLLNGVVVIDLSGYDPDIQSLIVAITLDLFYVQMQAAGSSKMDQQYRQLTKFILVDEADNFMSQGFPSLKKILKEGREFGVGTVLSTQFLKHFGTTDDDYAKYILTWVVHNVADLKPSDVEFVFNTEAKSPDTQRLFSDIKALQKHHSIVKIGTSKPAYIQDRAFWELYKDWHLN